MYVASLDASKAFDRVNHYGLLSKLCALGIPKCLISVMAHLLGSLSFIVKWKSGNSQKCCIHSGVQQGNISSPILFNVYLYDLIVKLKDMNLGCNIGDVFCGVLCYADDIALLSGSIMKLQLMLDVCSDYGVQFDIKFNGAKSMCMQVGECGWHTPVSVMLSNMDLQRKYHDLTQFHNRLPMPSASSLWKTTRQWIISWRTISTKKRPMSFSKLLAEKLT